MPGLCLNMIVRNEEAVLGRCLRSAAPWIERYAIVDTGSTDGTKDVVRRELEGIPGVIGNAPFEDFAQARNVALEIAREAVADVSCHLLLLDADMSLVVEDASALRLIDAPAYRMRQRTGTLSYLNTRIVRADVAARYVGRTHERLDLPPSTAPTLLEGAYLLDHTDGSSRAVKARRDLRLLREAVAADPNDARAVFYLAQTQREAAMLEDAIKSYERRIALGGSPEEVWYSRYMIAVCQEGLGRSGESLLAALQAYELRPWRAEPLHLLARRFSSWGDVATTEIFASAGRRIPRPPPTEILFVEENVYDHGFDELTMISGFHSLDPEMRSLSYDRCMSLAVDPDLAPYLREAAVQTTPRVCLRADAAFGARLQRIRLTPIAEGFVPMNPSILGYGEGKVAINVRWVNYRLGKPTPAKVETRNEIVMGTYGSSTSSGFVPEVRLPFDDMAGRSAEPGVVDRDGRIRGYEDCRLFMWRDGLWATATVCDRNRAARAEMALLDLTTGPEAVLVWECHVQRGREPERHQKNWIPIVQDDRLNLLYSADPTVLVEIDGDTCQARLQREKPPELALGGLRGGSQAIPFELDDAPGHLYVAHEVFACAPGQRWYTHRFVWLDAGLEIRHVSDPFHLYIRGIEFVAGLAAVGGDLVLSFGVEDCRAMLARAPRARVTEWLLAPSLRRTKANRKVSETR